MSRHLEAEPREHTPSAPLAHLVGHMRYVVLIAVVAVLLVAVALFLLGSVSAVVALWNAVSTLLSGQMGTTTDLTVQFLEIVSTMLKAIVFYIIGVAFYSLFIAPLNLPKALGMETLNDLETKVISVVIVIMAITFLEHFILWQDPMQTLQFGAALALVTAALVLFQVYNHRASQDQKLHTPEQAQAERDLFVHDQEQRVQPIADGNARTPTTREDRR